MLTAKKLPPRWEPAQPQSLPVAQLLRKAQPEVDVMAIAAESVMEAVKERVSPALDKLDETIRQSRRVMVRGQHAAEDAAAAATRRIKRHPLSVVTIGVGVGTVVGTLAGFGLGWVMRGRK